MVMEGSNAEISVVKKSRTGTMDRIFVNIVNMFHPTT